MDMMRGFSTLVLVVALGALVLAQAAGPAGGRAQQGSAEQTLRGLSEEWAK